MRKDVDRGSLFLGFEPTKPAEDDHVLTGLTVRRRMTSTNSYLGLVGDRLAPEIHLPNYLGALRSAVNLNFKLGFFICT